MYEGDLRGQNWCGISVIMIIILSYNIMSEEVSRACLALV